MPIEQHSVVTLHYTLTDDDGTVIDESRDGSFVYLHGANNIIPGLENALVGKDTGDSMQVSVTPEEGYGPREDGLTQQVTRDMFPPETEIHEGMQFHAQGDQGEMIVVTVVAVDGDSITVDGNHPLAGVNLNFDVTVMDIRAASTEELEHGHVHGPGGHDHG